MKKKNIKSENYLERCPIKPDKINWEKNEKGEVTLLIENTGVFNTLAQKLLKKPRISNIHLDEMGSFVWPLIDGEKNILELGEDVKAHFGEKAEPLYERLAKYFQILDSYGFIEWKK